MIQERRTSAKRTRADRSRRESLTPSSSQEPRATGKPAAMSHEEAKNREINSRVLFSKNADLSNLGTSLLEGNKDHLPSQARSELMKQKHQVGSLNDCISELQQQTYAQRLELQDAQHGFF